MQKNTYPNSIFTPEDEKRFEAEGKKRTEEHGARFAKAMEAIAEARAPYVEAVTSSLSMKIPGFLKIQERLAAQVREIDQSVLNGKLTRAEGWIKTRDALKELDKIRKKAAAVHADHHGLTPSADVVARILRKVEVDDSGDDWSAEGDEFGAYVYRMRKPNDIGERRDPLPGGEGDGDGGPPPLNFTLTPNYDIWRLDSSTSPLTIPKAAVSLNGSTFVQMESYELGTGGSARAFVGGDITIPAGFSSMRVSATIDTQFWGFALAIVGAAGAGGDALLEIGMPGSTAKVTSKNLGTVVAPVIFWNTYTRNATDVLSATVSVPSAGGSARVLAGVGAQSWAVLIGAVKAQSFGHVRRIDITLS